MAANEKAEAEKIVQIKRAEGEAEAKYLSGLGIAWQRQAIVDGLWDKRVGKYRNSRRSRPRLIMSCCANSYASLVLACSAT